VEPREPFAHRPPTTVLNSDDVRICFIGDSFVNGVGDRAYLGWVGRVCAATAAVGYDLTAYNLGVRRHTSEQIAQRWVQEVAARIPPDRNGRLVFSFGTNDTTVENGRQRVALAAGLGQARQLLSAAVAEYPVLMVGPPAIADAAQNQRTAELSQHYGTLCRDLGIPYLETLPPTQQSAVWMQGVTQGDGAHPNGGGYAFLADLVLGWKGWQHWFPALTSAQASREIP
jgi:lysophospholipase L1-like esterase